VALAGLDDAGVDIAAGFVVAASKRVPDWTIQVSAERRWPSRTFR
jgi:hypothetical protein